MEREKKVERKKRNGKDSGTRGCRVNKEELKKARS